VRGVCSVALVLLAGVARAQMPTGAPDRNPFGCRGEAEAIARDLLPDEIADEIRKRSEPVPGEDPHDAARRFCVVAELMRRVGDVRAPSFYEKAIAADPDEPGYELWYGYYYRNVRGAAGPNLEEAEVHHYRALEKLDRRRRAVGATDFDPATYEWTQRGLLTLYQSDGVPLLPAKAYDYAPDGLAAPGLFLSAIFSVSGDTHDFYHSSEVRNFTSEELFSQSAMRLNRPLTATEKYNLIRAPLRFDNQDRLRFRQNSFGALDVSYHYFNGQSLQIDDFSKPNHFVDVNVSEIGAAYDRVFDLYPLFDLNLRAALRHVARTGVVEFLPTQEQSFFLYEASPTLSRFIGPDKMSLNFTYVLMDIPRLETGVLSERARGETIRSAYLEYAMFRQVGPATRGWYFFAGYADDSQIYGQRQVMRRDLYGGTNLKGLGAWDVGVQGTVYTGNTYYVDPAGMAMDLLEDRSQQNAQYRTTLIFARRLIDEDTVPGLPHAHAGLAPASLVLVIPMSHDVAVIGPSDYEDIRVGGELWAKLIGTGFGGTTLLLTGGYDYQYFYRQLRSMHMAHLDVRVGW
jgi:hypothetical protein